MCWYCIESIGLPVHSLIVWLCNVIDMPWLCNIVDMPWLCNIVDMPWLCNVVDMQCSVM